MKLEVSCTVPRAVHLRELPETYRKMPILGRGATSVVLQDPDPNYVLLLTKDAIKSDWQTQSWGLAIGEHVEEYTANAHRKLHLRDYPLYVIRLPKLYPLSRSERAHMRKWMHLITKELRNEIAMERLANHGMRKTTAAPMAAARVSKSLRTDERFAAFEHREKFAHMLEFLTNYNDWLIDLHGANVMKNVEGELVICDPIISASLYQDLFGREAW